MFKLVLFELYKTWKNKGFLLPLALLALLNLIMLPYNLGYKVASYSGAAYKQIQMDMSNLSMEEKKYFLGEKFKKVEGLYRIESILRAEAESGTGLKAEREQFVSDFDKYYAIYLSKDYLDYCDTLGEEYSFIQQVKAEYETVSSYDRYLDNIIVQTQGLNDISIFNSREDSFQAQNQKKIEQTYKQLKDINVNFFPQRGLITILNYTVTDILFLCAAFLLFVSIGRKEIDYRIFRLIRSTRAGRIKTSFAKIVAMGFSLLVIVVLFYGINFTYSNMVYGIGDFASPIQSIALLQSCPLNVSIFEYLMLFLLSKWFSAILIGLWVVCALYIPRHTITAYLLAVSFPVLSLTARLLIRYSGKLEIFRYANIVTPFFASDYLNEYKNTNIFHMPINTTHIIWISSLIMAGILCTAYGLLLNRCEPETTHVGINLGHRGDSRPSSSIWKQECYKLFVLNKALLLLFAFVALNLLISWRIQYNIDSEEIYYRRYMWKIQGDFDQEKHQWLTEEYQKFSPILELEYAIKNKRITMDEYVELKKNNPSLQMEYTAFSRVLTQLKILNDIPHTKIVYESGYLKLFGVDTNENLRDALFCGLICSLTFSGYFAIEKNNGMEKVLASTTLGRLPTVKCKLLIAFYVSTAIVICNLGFRYWRVLGIYGLGVLDASLNSLSSYTNSIGIPLIFVLLLQLLFRLLAVYMVSICTMVISYKTGNQLLAGAISGAVFCLPILLNGTKAQEAIYFSIYPLFDSIALISRSYETAVTMIIVYSIIFSLLIYVCALYLKEYFGEPLPI